MNDEINTVLDNIHSDLLECQVRLNNLIYSLYSQGYPQGHSLERLWKRFDVDLSIIEAMRKERS